VRSLAGGIVIAVLLAGCGHSKQSTATTVSPVAKEECDGTSSNLEYTQCFNKLAQEAEANAAKELKKTADLAKLADQEYSWSRPKSIAPSEEEALANYLKGSQTHWEDYVEKQCELEAETSRGGSGTDTLRAKCHLRLARTRVAELQAAQKMIDRSR